MSDKENWVTMNEICKYLQFSNDTVKKLVDKGMPGYKPDGKEWRFKISEVDDWVKTKRVMGKTVGGEKKNV